MSTQLKQAIQIAQSLTLFEQLELLKTLSSMIQQTYPQASEPSQPTPEDEDTTFSAETFQRSWQQAMAGDTLPLSQLWEGIEDD